MNRENREELKKRIQDEFHGGISCVVLWVSRGLCEWVYDYCPDGEYEKSFIITFDERYHPVKREELSSMFCC